MNKRIRKYLALAVFLVLSLVFSTGVMAAGKLKDGTYDIKMTCTGGSGRGRIESAQIIASGGSMKCRITMSSTTYTKAVVNGQSYNKEGGTDSISKFTFPISSLDGSIKVVVTTVAMSQPHDIDYILTLDSSSLPSTAYESSGGNSGGNSNNSGGNSNNSGGNSNSGGSGNNNNNDTTGQDALEAARQRRAEQEANGQTLRQQNQNQQQQQVQQQAQQPQQQSQQAGQQASQQAVQQSQQQSQPASGELTAENASASAASGVSRDLTQNKSSAVNKSNTASSGASSASVTNSSKAAASENGGGNTVIVLVILGIIVVVGIIVGVVLAVINSRNKKGR